MNPVMVSCSEATSARTAVGGPPWFPEDYKGQCSEIIEMQKGLGCHACIHVNINTNELQIWITVK